MIKLRFQVLEEDHSEDDGKTRDEVILAIDEATKKEAVWESDGENSWVLTKY